MRQHRQYSLIVLLFYVLCLFPFFSAGHWFALDFGVTQHIDRPLPGTNFRLPQLGLKSLSLILPMWFAEKILILTPFALSVYYWSFHQIQKGVRNPFISILLLFNPRTYGRLIDGQLNMIYMLILFSFLLHNLLLLLSKGVDYKVIIRVILLSILLPGISLHSLPIITVLFFLVSCIHIAKDGLNKKIALTFSLIFGVTLLGNFYLLFPYRSNSVPTSSNLINQIELFQENHVSNFATNDSNLPVGLNTLFLRGYRGETTNRFPLMSKYSSFWRIPTSFLLLIVIQGVVVGWRRNREVTLFLLGVGLCTWWLGQGVAGRGPIGSFTQWLYDHLPFYQGMREPQKRIGLLVIVYAFLGGWGVDHVVRTYLQKPGREVIRRGLLLLPVWMTPQLLFGAQGNIVIRPYPESWETARSMIHEHHREDCPLSTEIKECYSSIMLPWHGYMTFRRIGKNTGSRIGRFFGTDVIFGDTVGMPGLYTQSTRPESALIEDFVKPGGRFWESPGDEVYRDRLDLMQGLGIEYMIFVDAGDIVTYQPIEQTMQEKGYITPVYTAEEVRLYSITQAQ